MKQLRQPKQALQRARCLTVSSSSARGAASFLSCPNDILRLLIEQHLDDIDAVILRCVCRRLRVLVSRAQLERCRQKLFTDSAEHGYLSRLEWLFSNQRILPTPSRLCESAARHGHLSCLQWLRSHDVPWFGKSQVRRTNIVSFLESFPPFSFLCVLHLALVSRFRV